MFVLLGSTLQWNPIGITMAGNGSSGNASNQLSGPIGIFIDVNDVLYVADSNNHRILKIASNANGTNIGTVIAGTTGVSTNSFSTLNIPTAIYVDAQQNLYIVDTYHFRVQFWAYGALNGSTVAGSSAGVGGSTLNMLGYSYGLYVDTARNVYVSDGANARIVKWSPGAVTGVLVAGNGSAGFGSGQLGYPIGIAADSQSNTFYIVDHNLHTVVAWPSGMTTGTIVAGLNSTAGNIPGLLQSPWSIIRDTYGNLYVADSGNHRIQMFCAVGSSFSTGTTIAGVGLAQVSSRGLNYPTGLAFDSQMNLYVVDYGNNRVQKFLRTSWFFPIKLIAATISFQVQLACLGVHAWASIKSDTFNSRAICSVLDHWETMKSCRTLLQQQLLILKVRLFINKSVAGLRKCNGKWKYQSNAFPCSVRIFQH